MYVCENRRYLLQGVTSNYKLLTRKQLNDASDWTREVLRLNFSRHTDYPAFRDFLSSSCQMPGQHLNHDLFVPIVTSTNQPSNATYPDTSKYKS